jgi:hypothetical protein
LAVGVTLARRFLETDEKDAAGRALGFASLLTSFQANEWALARQAAQLFETAGRPERATAVWRTLLATASLPAQLRLAWLPDALNAARSARNAAQAQAWQSELTALTVAAEKKSEAAAR